MNGNEVRMRNGQRWSAQHFLDHYQRPTASGATAPPWLVRLSRLMWICRGTWEKE